MKVSLRRVNPLIEKVYRHNNGVLGEKKYAHQFQWSHYHDQWGHRQDNIRSLRPLFFEMMFVFVLPETQTDGGDHRLVLFKVLWGCPFNVKFVEEGIISKGVKRLIAIKYGNFLLANPPLVSTSR